MADRATTQLLDAISAWRSAHKSDPSFGQIDAKLTSLVDDLQGDKDGDLKTTGKPSFPNAQNFAARMAAARSARGTATAQSGPGAATARKGN